MRSTLSTICPAKVYWTKLKGLEVEISSALGHAPATVLRPVPPLDFTGDADVLKVLAEGERLSFGHLMNPAFGTEVSCIDPLPHQRVAVYGHMLSQDRLRLLLADDAGAGKTSMSGLYVREMLSRRLLTRIIIIVRPVWWAIGVARCSICLPCRFASLPEPTLERAIHLPEKLVIESLSVSIRFAVRKYLPAYRNRMLLLMNWRFSMKRTSWLPIVEKTSGFAKSSGISLPKQ